MKKIPAHFKLKIRGLGIGSHPVELSVPADQLDIPMFHDNVIVHGEIIVSDRLELHLQIEGNGTFICDRCAVEFDKTFSPHLDLFYVPPQLAKDIEDDDNIHTFDPQLMNEIDFTSDIRDALLLAIPMKNLHDQDCEGVDLGAGQKMIDERLSSLGNLYERLREEEMNSDAPGSVSQG
jgi:uncharacterized metal-binding protein YceD (DUF177 family)